VAGIYFGYLAVKLEPTNFLSKTKVVGFGGVNETKEST